ncbi:hypothetical protein [Streptomyces sp. NPDC056056]|uniref:hypothetical protein n=1 Tax=Streptomyces sp. NPDC056056 TaxID=3345698 RepID=UPI0035DC8C52
MSNRANKSLRRASACSGKKRFTSTEAADRAASEYSRFNPAATPKRSYPCRHCGGLHIGRMPMPGHDRRRR